MPQMPCFSRVGGAEATVAAAMLLTLSLPILAASPPERKCAGAKARAAGSVVEARARCGQRARLAGTPMDPACLTRASDALIARFARADARASCAGDAGATLAAASACTSSFDAALAGDSRCAAAKLRAAGRCVSARARCTQKAMATGGAVAAGCVARAGGTLAAAVAKADAAGQCAGTAEALASSVDACLATVLPSTTTTSSTVVGVTTTTVPRGPAAVDYTARGYYTRSGGVPTFHPGMPSSAFRALPATLTHGELERLQHDCIDRINQYRAGAVRFSNGTADPGVPKPPLTHFSGNDVCSSQQALGDLYANGGAGGCAASHTNAFTCPWSAGVGQNSCCFRTASTYAAIRTQLFQCLQGMWDEGIGQPDDAGFTLRNGHWFNMRSSGFRYAHCGFAFTANGGVWMNQDFTERAPEGVPLTCSCAGKRVGDADGCGGTCVSAD